jgi:exopolysaccharide biosynthesis polyprenyl glycosylphosphotransferase
MQLSSLKKGTSSILSLHCKMNTNKQSGDFFLALHQVIDVLVISIAYWAAFQTRNLSLNSNTPYVLIFVLTIICCHLSLRLFGIYSPTTNKRFAQIFSKIIKSGVTGTCSIIFLMYLLHIEAISRLFLGMFLIYFILFLTLIRALLHYLLRYRHRQNHNTRNILIIGSRHRALDLVTAILKDQDSDYRIFGCLEIIDAADEIGKKVLKDVTVIATLEKFNEILLTEVIDEIIFAMPLKNIDKIHEYIFFAENLGINVLIMPDFQIQRIMYYPETAKISINSFMGMPFMSLSSTPRKDSDLMIKTFLDYFLAVVGIIILSPLLILIVIAIKITSKGPVLFSQIRCGLNGRQFKFYKFRTMVVNAESLKEELKDHNEMDGPVFKMTKDPRVTPIGHFLRATSLDELPQLFNILKGEMSLVGPRPPLPSEVREYQLWQRRKLSMKPGLTCIWQVSGRNNIPFQEWMKMDLEYIDNWSLFLDFKLLALTAKEVIIGGGK